MPISTQSRRHFVGLTVAAVAGSCFGRTAEATGPVPSGEIAFLSDPHVSGDASKIARDVNMTEHLSRVVDDVVATMPPHSDVIVNGDCAYLKGLADDYKQFVRLVSPLMKVGHRLHVTMGNHDDRGPFLAALQTMAEQDVAVSEKHVGTIELDRFHLVLLDSLWKVDVVTGQFGSEQITWLTDYANRHADTPLLIVGHHNLQLGVQPGQRVSGLSDSDEFVKVLSSHPNIRAYFYGHTHEWKVQPLRRRDPNLQLVNLPAVAYVFNSKEPSGWVHGRRDGDSLRLKIHCLDDSHPANGETVSLPLKDTVAIR
ncbi:MAG: metallophosphoesterase [Planctomycetota bacterium]